MIKKSMFSMVIIIMIFNYACIFNGSDDKVSMDVVINSIEHFNQQNDFGKSLYVGHIRSILIDKENHLWLGGDVGVARFDGEEWALFDIEYFPRNPFSSSNPGKSVTVLSTQQDRFDDIYVTSVMGCTKYNDQGNWEESGAITSEDVYPDTFSWVNGLKLDKYRYPVLYTKSKILRYNGSDWEIKYTLDESLFQIRNVTFDKNNRILALVDGNILRIDENNHVEVMYVNEDDGSRFTQLSVDSNNICWAMEWIGSPRVHYKLYNYHGETFKLIEEIPISKKNPGYFIIDQENCIWFYGEGGIDVLKNNQWFRHNSSTMDIPPDISHLYIDKYNNVWGFGSNEYTRTLGDPYEFRVFCIKREGFFK